MSNISHALFDGDVITYRIGFSCEKQGIVVDDLGIAFMRVDDLIQRTLANTGASNYSIYLTGKDNFRFQYNPEYKANRDPTAKPVYYQDIKDYLIQNWNAEVVDGCEADDAMSIAQSTLPNTVICTIDKDLRQVPGWHYNFAKEELGLEYIEPFEGLKFFYQQFLLGDTVDNIIGVRGIGPVKSKRIVDSCETELELFQTIRDIYDNDERLLMNGICLWMQREPGQIWKFPEGALDDEETTESFSLYAGIP